MPETLIRFAHISDTHVAPEGHSHAFDQYPAEMMEILKEALEAMGEREMVPVLPANRTLVEALNNVQEPLDFVLHTGDVNTDPEGPDHYAVTKEIFKDLKYPIHYLAGNHDNVSDLQTVLVGSSEVRLPYDYTFEVNGVQIVCLDTASNGVNHGGKLSDEQLHWLAAQINPEDPRPLVVGIHHPLLKFGHKLLDYFGTSNGDDIHKILVKSSSRLRGVFFGHIHMDFESYQDGILYSCVPSPSVEVGQPTGFKIVTVTTTGTHIRHHTVAL